MAMIFQLRDHARASVKSSVGSNLRAAKPAKTSKVMSTRSRSVASATTEAQCGAGIPLVRQPLTVEADWPSAKAMTPVPPSDSMIDCHVNMPHKIVRALRTCQVVAICETTFRSSYGALSSMGTDQDIARRLIAVREHFKLSQVEFAGEINIAKNTLNGYERAARRLTIENAVRIRERFGVSVDWLLFGDVGQPSHDLAVRLGPAPRLKSEAKRQEQAKEPRKTG